MAVHHNHFCKLEFPPVMYATSAVGLLKKIPKKRSSGEGQLFDKTTTRTASQPDAKMTPASPKHQELKICLKKWLALLKICQNAPSLLRKLKFAKMIVMYRHASAESSLNHHDFNEPIPTL